MTFYDILVTSVLIPVLLLVVKNLIGGEISYWLSFVRCYLHRPFDVDGDPSTHDWAMIHDDVIGWECCSLTFSFELNREASGVFLHHYDEKWRLIFSERILFDRWSDMRKGRINDVDVIGALKRLPDYGACSK